MKVQVGEQYGRLYVLGFDHINKRHNAMFLCKCECGCTTVVKGSSLVSGKTKSCGCLKREMNAQLGSRNAARSSARMKEFNKTAEHRKQASEAATTHGGTSERLFRIWGHMKERCDSTKGDHARWYHERGIRVCPEWHDDYAAFRAWSLANGYYEQSKDVPLKARLSIDRIDPDKGYSPDNCRWITFSENASLRNQYHANQR